MTATSLQRAADHVDATEILTGIWAHHDAATDCWYAITADELTSLVGYLDSEDEQIRSDAYSHWCSGSTSVQMPSEWSPEDAIALSVEGTQQVLTVTMRGREFAAQGATTIEAIHHLSAVVSAHDRGLVAQAVRS